MKCIDIKHTLTDYLRGKVSQDEYRHISDHLADCQSCRSEAEELSAFIELVKDEKTWAPSDAYWTNILPKIHQRLQNRKGKYLPDWVARFVLPLSAAIVLIIFSVRYFVTTTLETSHTIQSALTQIPADELQYYVEQQSIVGVIGDQVSPNGSIISEDDKIILKNIVQNESYLYEGDGDYDWLLDAINENEVDNILTIIEKKKGPS